MTLLPTSTEYSTAHWTPVGETEIYECLDDDNGNTSYVKCSASLRHIILGFADPSVAEEDIASITSVRFLSSGRSNSRTTASLARIGYETPSGNTTALLSYDASPSYETINGAAKIYSDGLGATDWTYSDLENLEMRVIKALTVELYLSYLAMQVEYVSTVVEEQVDNAPFFGTNF